MGSRYYETNEPQDSVSRAGSGILNAAPGISVQALFRRRTASNLNYEAAIPSSSGANELSIPFDATTFDLTGAQLYTGLALVNLDPIRAANIACTARDSKGVVIPNAIPALVAPPLGHWAGFNFPALTGANGAVSCVSSVKIAAVALRSLGTEAISSLPVAAPKNSSAGSQVTSSLPHFAVGESFSTDLYIVNGGDQPATFSMSLLDDSGASVRAPFRGLGVQSTIVDSVPAHGTRRYEARAEQDNAALKSGWVLIQGDPTVTAQALLRRQTTGNIVYEAAIPSTLGANELRIAFDGAVFVPTGAQTFTGVAIANLERSFARVECVARGAEGIVIPGAIAALELGPLGHWAAFDFPKLAGQRGSIDCVSNTKIGAVALRALGAEAISTLPVLLVDH